jgi:hypothetical protein
VQHDGEAHFYDIHIDGDVLDAAKLQPASYPPKWMLSLLMHETAHTWFDANLQGFPPHETALPADGAYKTIPWKYFEPEISTATSGCIKP